MKLYTAEYNEKDDEYSVCISEFYKMTARHQDQEWEKLGEADSFEAAQKLCEDHAGLKKKQPRRVALLRGKPKGGDDLKVYPYFKGKSIPKVI